MIVETSIMLDYDFPVAAKAATRRGDRVNCKARSALNLRFFCGRFPHWRMARGNRKAGRCPCRPVFPLPAFIRRPRRGKRSGGLPICKESVMIHQDPLFFVALWAWMRANPGGEFDEFDDAITRILERLAMARARAQQEAQPS